MLFEKVLYLMWIKYANINLFLDLVNVEVKKLSNWPKAKYELKMFSSSLLWHHNKLVHILLQENLLAYADDFTSMSFTNLLLSGRACCEPTQLETTTLPILMLWSNNAFRFDGWDSISTVNRRQNSCPEVGGQHLRCPYLWSLLAT